MELVVYPNRILRSRCTPYAEKDMDEARAVGGELAELMYRKHGVGLAGPQGGVARCIYVVDVSEERDSPIVLINPCIEGVEGSETGEEGCLSFPGIFSRVARGEYARVAYVDLDGEPRIVEGEGLLARALQHEYDHLEGVLFVDRLGAGERQAIRKEIKDLERAAAGDG
ncbi:MAG: peptide deformylase [Planctomycetes bacterium]|nr:peptide deformylase [Planctomycetota bacterium]